MPTTCFSNGAGVWRVWVALVLTEVLRNVVTGQLCHDVWDVAKGTQVLQTFMSSTCQEIRSRSFRGNAIHFNYYLFRHTRQAKYCVLCCGERKGNTIVPALRGLKFSLWKQAQTAQIPFPLRAGCICAIGDMLKYSTWNGVDGGLHQADRMGGLLDKLELEWHWHRWAGLCQLGTGLREETRMQLASK